MKKRYLGLLVLALGIVSCHPAEKYYVKEVTFPQGISPEEKIDIAARVVPSAEQYAWQQMELTAFVHFGMNTFTGREWGDGKESPELFNPERFNAEQWVKALQAGGFKMVILTAKHHDGFCLWPTKTTAHSVASSPWKEGKGDVVRDLKAACDKFGMKFGVYLSPWDRNASCYGDSPVYNRMFMEQLKELLGNYGEIHEVWFDGANAEGPNGKKQVYDWTAFYRVIDSLQPHAVKAIMGDDVRWVGNERGLGRETEWSVTPLRSSIYEDAETANERLGLKATGKDLGSREKVMAADRLFWYPSEVDVSIRPGWFYHQEQDHQVKSLSHLLDIYFQSVGYNSVLLLNVPPDRRGLIHEQDVARLKEFGEYISRTFADNKLEAPKTEKVLKEGESVEYTLKPEVFNVFMVGEEIRKGQRVEEFTVEAYSDGEWKELVKGTTIGYKRLFRFPDCRAEKLRLTVNKSRAEAHILQAGAFYAGTTDVRENDFHVSDVSVKDWKVIASDSEISGQEAGFAIDSNPATCWRSAEGKEHSIVVDMGKEHRLKGFTYLPVAGEDKAGTVFTYEFYVSTDNRNWTKCACSGEFSNIMHNPVPQTVVFGEVYPARYFKFKPVREIADRPFVTVGELGVLTQ